METNLVSKETVVHIDRKVKTGRITYREVRASEKGAEELGKMLGTLERKKSFSSGVKGIELSMIMFRSKKGKLAVEVFFDYQKEKRMCEALGLSRKEDGAIRFEPSERETLLSTNGDSTESHVTWGKDVRKLRFELSGAPLGNKERQGMQVLKYIRD